MENNGRGVVSDWDLPSSAQGRLDSRLVLLAAAEVNTQGKVQLPAGMVAGPKIYGQKHIYKLKVHGDVALRPMFCLGPTEPATQWTILARATETDNDTREQRRAAEIAAVRRAEILEGSRKRKLYREGKGDD